jgi:capsular polysaccharide biosynthesis protein
VTGLEAARRRPRWWLVAALAVVGAVAGLAVASAMPPMSSATATVFVGAPGPRLLADRGEPAPGTGGWGTAQLLETYAGLVTRPIVLRPVAEELRLPVAELAHHVSATTDGGSLLVSIAATDASPARAADVANAVAVRLTEVVGEVTPRGAEAVRATVVERAVARTAIPSPSAAVGAALGAIGGALAGVVVLAVPALLRDARRRPPAGPAAPSMF